MRLQAKTLESETVFFELEDIEKVYADDDVIYISECLPCKLSTVAPAPIETKDQLIIEIMHLAYLVQRNTNYCVFFSFSGHVETFEIRITESRQNWQNKVLETEFDTIYKAYRAQGDQQAFFKAKRDVLLRIIAENEIPYELCDIERYTVEEMSF
jgi:hypothetical protein